MTTNTITLDQLVTRLHDLEDMEIRIQEIVGRGFVGGAEIKQIETIENAYGYDHDDWFSDRLQVEAEIEKMESSLV